MLDILSTIQRSAIQQISRSRLQLSRTRLQPHLGSPRQQAEKQMMTSAALKKHQNWQQTWQRKTYTQGKKGTSKSSPTNYPAKCTRFDYMSSTTEAARNARKVSYPCMQGMACNEPSRVEGEHLFVICSLPCCSVLSGLPKNQQPRMGQQQMHMDTLGS